MCIKWMKEQRTYFVYKVVHGKDNWLKITSLPLNQAWMINQKCAKKRNDSMSKKMIKCPRGWHVYLLSTYQGTFYQAKMHLRNKGGEKKMLKKKFRLDF